MNLQYACILIMAVLALPFFPALATGPFFTPALVGFAFGVAVLVVAAAMLMNVRVAIQMQFDEGYVLLDTRL